MQAASPFLVFLGLAALGNVAYHLGQKSLSHHINPMLMLAVLYAFAMLGTLALMPLFGKARLVQAAELAANPRLWLAAAGIMLIELGFLMAYRTGGSVQWSGVAVNGAAALLLVPFGLLVFKEPLSWQKIAGIVLTLAGLYCLVRK